MAAPFHLVMDLAADNGLDPYARALVDSLRSETWPDDWLITLLLDGRGERDTLYTYRNGTWHALPRSEIASGDPQTLRTLLLQTANVPNAHVPWVVVLWGHGNGWFREGPEGWGQDWSPSGALEWVDGEIREAFLALPRKPDWLFFDACAMAQMEVITAVCPSVHRLGASLGLMPSDGLPWLQALRFARTSRAPVEVWVDSLLLWYERLQAWYPVTYTIWDCEKVTSWLDRWREEAGDPLWAYAEGRMYRDAIRLLPGPSFYRPGLDTLGPVVDLPELLDLLGLSALKDSLAQARIASIGSDSAYGSRRGPGVWRPPSPTSFRSLLQDYLRLKDTFSKSWVAFVQGVWGPDTLPPVWLSPWIQFEQRSREWWGGWGTAKDPLGIAGYEVRLYRSSSVSSPRSTPADVWGSVIPRDTGWQMVREAGLRWRIPEAASGEEFWVRTTWRGRTGFGDTLWINGVPRPLDEASPGRAWVRVDSLPPDTLLDIRVVLAPGRSVNLLAVQWFLGRRERETWVTGPSVWFPPAQDPSEWVLWVRAVDPLGNRSAPIWGRGKVRHPGLVRWRGAWEVWIPESGAWVWVVSPVGRVLWHGWMQEGWRPLHPLSVLGVYRVHVRTPDGRGGEGVFLNVP